MKKRIGWLGLAAALALALAGCQQEGLFTGSVVLEGEHHLARGESMRGAVLFLNGSLSVAEGAVLGGPVYMLGGRLESYGEIAGDLSVLGGELVLGPASVVGGDLNLGGGQVDRAPGAVVAGQVNTGVGLQVPDRPALFHETLRDQLPGFIIQSVLLAGLAYLSVKWFPNPVRRVSKAIIEHPLISAAMGLLVGTVALVLVVLIAFTIILVPLSFLFGFLIILAVAFGWVSIGAAVGRLLLRRSKRSLSPGLVTALGTLVFVFLMNLASLLPRIEGIIPLMLGITALGAVFLTRFGLSEFVPASDSPGAEF
jgi:hypothetical protein